MSYRSDWIIPAVPRYLTNIGLALLCLPLVAAVITCIYLLFLRFRDGHAPRRKVWAFYFLALYFLVAYYLVIIPLPESLTGYAVDASTPQLRPFLFLSQLWQAAQAYDFSWRHPGTWMAFFTSALFFEIAFNILLTVPLGAFTQGLFHKGIRWALLAGFLISLFFEISQITAFFGVFDAPYRLFDVDDLILNTLGALLGWIIMLPFSSRRSKARD